MSGGNLWPRFLSGWQELSNESSQAPASVFIYYLMLSWDILRRWKNSVFHFLRHFSICKDSNTHSNFRLFISRQKTNLPKSYKEISNFFINEGKWIFLHTFVQIAVWLIINSPKLEWVFMPTINTSQFNTWPEMKTALKSRFIPDTRYKWPCILMQFKILVKRFGSTPLLRGNRDGCLA